MLRAGYHRIDITPGADCGLIGYEFRGQELPPGNAGVHDPLYASVLVLDDGQALAALVTLDLCVLRTDLARALRSAVAGKLATSADRVAICCSHTHSGPFPELPTDKSPDGPNQRYAAMLSDRLVEAAAAAKGLTYPVELAVQQAPLGIAYNRRIVDGQGVRHCWNPQEFPELSPGPAPDPTCTVLVLRRTAGTVRYVLWGLGAHAVVLGKTSRVVSADWPGLANRMIEDQLPETHAMFCQGASGDTHPWVATQESPDGRIPVANAASTFVALLTESVRAGDDKLAIAAKTVTFGGNELDIALWRIGPAYFAALPVELFGELACDLRRRLDAPVLLATCANGWTGYWPTRQAFAEGGYEVTGSWGIAAGDAEKLIDDLVALTNHLHCA